MLAELGKRGNKKVGEEVSVWSNGGVIRNLVTSKLYILIRDNSHTPYLPPQPMCLGALIIHVAL